METSYQELSTGSGAEVAIELVVVGAYVTNAAAELKVLGEYRPGFEALRRRFSRLMDRNPRLQGDLTTLPPVRRSSAEVRALRAADRYVSTHCSAEPG